MILKIDSVRARLTVYYVSALAVALLVVGGLIYLLLARVLYARIDDNLDALMQVTSNSLHNDLAEGQDPSDAARSTAAEIASRLEMLAIYDGRGVLLAEEQRAADLAIALPPLEMIPSDHPRLVTVSEAGDADDRHRLAMRRVIVRPPGTEFIVVAGSPLEPTDDELEQLRKILLYVVPLALAVAGLGGWFLAQRSLSPVAVMAERARRIGVSDLTARLPVVNPGDELGQLATTINDLLGRLEASLVQQRQFMTDASHELRTPVTTTRTAAAVALQQPHRDEREYRDTLALIEQQTSRLSRVVEDMFTLARADAGRYPVRRDAMYLDEVIDELARAARVIASTRNVRIDVRCAQPAPLTGDEDLIRRLIGNLVHNAVRHAPDGSVVDVVLEADADRYAIVVRDTGAGIPPETQPYIFERFFRVDTARSREQDDGGAGLGLALARWVARVHGGDVVLTRSSSAGSTFTAFLPRGT